jgi:acyl transferase domain-containing protein
MRSDADDIAIIGMACIFPGAPDVQTYWQNIMLKKDAVSDPPADWGADDVFNPESTANDQIYCKRGGFLADLAEFNPLDYGIIPNAVNGSDPDQFLALRVAYEALRDAGYLDRSFNRKRTSVILGRANQMSRGHVTALQHGLILDQMTAVLKKLHPEYSKADLQAIRKELKSNLPPFNAETAPGIIPNVVSGRIANRLNLQGSNFTVDAACASSLIAVDLGVRDLRSRRCDIALVGGVQAETPIPFFMIFCNLGALSRKGQIRPFDKDADGTLLGEGVGMAVLKRREDAERDQDLIYALIKSVGIASDGRGQAILVPRVEGEELALRRAYDQANISPEAIGLIEAHGTGTRVGDLAEIQSLTRVFGLRNGSYPRCAIGSVKSMISHSIPAAGIAGLIKTALALHHKILPPTLNFEEPNPEFQLDRTPFFVNTETRPWVHGEVEPRRAGVNAFGFGGINSHAILEEYTG